jgi:uncharacterized Tic20 family protein
MTEQPATVTPNEGLLAALAHFFGVLAAFVVWVTQRNKSRFVRFQSMQAMVFDLLVYIFTFLVVSIITMIIIGLLVLGIVDMVIFGSQVNPNAEIIRIMIAWMTATPFFLAGVLVLIFIILFVARLIASVQTLQGKSFYYPWLGAMVERSMGN